MARVTLPVGHKAQEVHLAAEHKMWQELVGRLHAQAPNEGCTFVLARPSVGSFRATLILNEPIWPNVGEMLAKPAGLDISADYISRAIDAAIDAGPLVGLVLVHTHPRSDCGEGFGRFSARDDWYESRLFPTIARSRRQAICGSLVLGSAGDLDGRIWWCDEEGHIVSQPAMAVRIVGPELTILETPSSTWKDHPDPTIMDRSTRLWGEEGRRRLQNLRIGIPGAGGTGSLTTFALATMGTGKLQLWDKDVATKQNRHRTAGITQDFVDRPKVEGIKALAESVATANPFSIEVHNAWATTAEGLRQLRDCDLIFCCVDNLAARVPLNDLAYAHLIPVIDIASWIHPDKKKRIDTLMTHAQVWSPGKPCAWCRETLTSYALTREAQGSQQGIETRAPYGIPLEDTDGVEPSVLPLNMLGVSLALIEFMQVALKFTDRTPNDLKFILPAWELDESDRPAQPSCDCVRSAGAGETLHLAPVITE